MNWFLKRLSEPTTWLGLATSVVGVGQLGKINEAPVIADAVAGAGQAIAAGMPWWQAALLGIGGIAAVFMKEKGGR